MKQNQRRVSNADVRAIADCVAQQLTAASSPPAQTKKKPGPKPKVKVLAVATNAGAANTNGKRAAGKSPTTAGKVSTASINAATCKAAPKAPRRLNNAQLQAELERVQNELNHVKTELAALKAKQSGAPPPPTKHQRHRAANQALNEADERARRANNVIIRGIAPSGDGHVTDEEAVKSFLSAAKVVDVEVKKIQRQLAAAPKPNDVSNRVPSPTILVVLDSAAAAQKVLKATKNHELSNYQGVFSHEDRTDAQREQFTALRRKAHNENMQLDRLGLLNQPFRFVVREQRNQIACIDFAASARAKQSVYIANSDVNTAKLAASAKAKQDAATCKTAAASNSKATKPNGGRRTDAANDIAASVAAFTASVTHTAATTIEELDEEDGYLST